MLRPISKTTFIKDNGDTYVFDFCNKIEIKTSYETLTDTAKITLPSKLSFQGKVLSSGENPIFKRGDAVKIELGYYPNLDVAFEGFISYVGTSMPLEIECEDAMFKLKNIKVANKSYTNLTLKDFLTATMPTIETDALSVTLGTIKINGNVSASKVLDKLKSDYGFYSYFRNGILHVGFPNDATDTETKEFEFERTIIDSDSLRYQDENEMFLKVIGISMQSDNSKKQVEVGDLDGNTRTFYTYNSTDEQLLEFANLKLNKFKYTGYNGSFETFGEPFVRHGDIAKLISKKYPERDGNYLISRVTRTFGMNGYRQEIDLDGKV